MMGHLTTLSAELLRDYTRTSRVRAVQVTDTNAAAIAQMVGGKLQQPTPTNPVPRVYFYCCHTRVKAEWGDWIIQEGRNFRTMTNDDFQAEHQEAP